MRASTVSLPERFLADVVATLDNGNVVGILLGGSYARGDATEWSDVDFAPLYRDDAQVPRKRFYYRDGRLVSVSSKTVAGVRAAMSRPNTAIWVVPGIAGCRVLLDKDGSASRLVQEAHDFSWQQLQKAADAYASFEMMIDTEVVHKLISELAKSNMLALASVTPNLLAGLTDAVAVQRGVMVNSESTYFSQVEESVGVESSWTRFHRLALGLDPVDSGITMKARAVLALYGETVELLRDVMEPEHLAVAEGAALLARRAGGE
jgi:hypothetical protein